MKRVALVRLDALGDSLLCTPACLALQERYPEAELVILSSPVAVPIFQGLGRVLSVPGEAGATQIAELLRGLEADAVVAFSEKRRAIQGAHQSGIGVRVGFDPSWSQPLKSAYAKVALTHRVTYENRLDRASEMHEVERYVRLVEQLGVEPSEPPGLYFPLAERPPRKGLVAFQLTRKWELEGWSAAMVSNLVKALDRDFLFLVGPGEESWAAEVVDGAECHPDLNDYAGVLARCPALVTVDTGAAHLAAAVGTPVVDIFPQAHQDHCVPRWRPWKTPHQVLLKAPPEDLAPEITKALGTLLD